MKLPKFSIVWLLLFVTITFAATVVTIRDRKFEEHATIHITSPTSSYGWSFEQNELIDVPYWPETPHSTPPLSLGAVRQIADKIAKQLEAFCETDEPARWEYGSILATKIERGYSDERNRWTFVIVFTPWATAPGVYLGPPRHGDVKIMVLMNGTYYVSDDSWAHQKVRAFLLDHQNDSG